MINRKMWYLLWYWKRSNRPTLRIWVSVPVNPIFSKWIKKINKSEKNFALLKTAWRSMPFKVSSYSFIRWLNNSERDQLLPSKTCRPIRQFLLYRVRSIFSSCRKLLWNLAKLRLSKFCVSSTYRLDVKTFAAVVAISGPSIIDTCQ